jgi:hypothetical protein
MLGKVWARDHTDWFDLMSEVAGDREPRRLKPA